MPDPWDRRGGETGRAHAALLDYCAMGPGRSLRSLWAFYRQQLGDKGATKPPSKRLRTLARWSTENDWPERAAAWDVGTRTQEETRWAEFMERQRDKEAKVVAAMLEKVTQMLRFPVAATERTETISEDGKTTVLVTKVVPVRWRMGDVARIVDSMAKLARLAAKEEKGERDSAEVVIRVVYDDE